MNKNDRYIVKGKEFEIERIIEENNCFLDDLMNLFFLESTMENME